MSNRASCPWIVAFLGLLFPACAGVAHGSTIATAPAPAPMAHGASLLQDPAPKPFANFQPRLLGTEIHPVFEGNPSAARRTAEVKDVLSRLSVQPSAAMTTGALATMARELADVARGITDAPTREAVVREIDALLVVLGTDPAATVSSRIGPAVARDRWTRRPSASVRGLSGYFEDGNDVTVPLVLHDGDVHAAYQTTEDAIRLVAVTSLLERALELNLDFAAAQDDLEANAAAWRAVLHRGYAQFPWEGWLNGAFNGSAWDQPASNQFVLLHPEPGVVLGLDNLRRSAADPTLMVHGLGWVHYFEDRADWFLGVAGTVAATDDEQQGFAYGATLLFGSTRADSSLPHISVGLLWSDGEDDGLHLSLGLDALRLASRALDR